jgi:hypothetical protein
MDIYYRPSDSRVESSSIVFGLRSRRGMDFPATVVPFILRAVTLIGIDSVMCPRPERMEARDRLAKDLDVSKLDAMTNEVELVEEVIEASMAIPGRIRWRLACYSFFFPFKVE